MLEAIKDIEAKCLKIADNDLKPKIASEAERSSLLLGGALVADAFRDGGDADWGKTIRRDSP